MILVVKDPFRDSTIWNAVKPRQTDIVIASCYKSGTTLTQQIVNLMINGNSDLKGYEFLHKLSPWVEWLEEIPDVYDSIEAKLNSIENLPDPRFFKSHLPFDALPYYPEWKYIYLVRDGRDVALSLYNHNQSYAQNFNVNNELKSEGSFAEFWDEWLETGGHIWSFWEHVTSWWNARNITNVLLIHYSDLIKDKLNVVEKIAEFLEFKLDAEKREIILHESSLEYMKENWEKFQPPGLLPQKFFNKGKNGVWKDFLTSERVEKYEKICRVRLGIECSNWVKNSEVLPLLREEALGETAAETLSE